MEESPEEEQEEQAIVQGRCKRFCGLKREIRWGKKIEAALNVFVTDAQPTLCVHREAVQEFCGIPEPVEEDEDYIN